MSKITLLLVSLFTISCTNPGEPPCRNSTSTPSWLKANQVECSHRLHTMEVDRVGFRVVVKCICQAEAK